MFCQKCKEVYIYDEENICGYCKEEERGGWVFVVWDWREGKVLAYSRMNDISVPASCQLVAIKAINLRKACKGLDK